MKETVKRTKWYWWLPIIGLYFIEEISGWAFDATEILIRVKRITMSYLIMMFHCLCIVTLIALLF